MCNTGHMQFVRSCATYVGFSIAPSLTCTYAPALLPLHYISASTAGKTQPFHPLLNRTLTGCLQSTYLTKRNNAKALLFSQADDWTSCLFFLITAKPKKKRKKWKYNKNSKCQLPSPCLLRSHLSLPNTEPRSISRIDGFA